MKNLQKDKARKTQEEKVRLRKIISEIALIKENLMKFGSDKISLDIILDDLVTRSAIFLDKIENQGQLQKEYIFK